MEQLKFILAAGFLGSGKTTYLLKEAKRLCTKGFRCAVIVNEASETGVDNLEYRRAGLNVSEIFGGCICCTLSVSLSEAIASLTEDYALDYILIEPSGAAEPSALVDELLALGGSREAISVVGILDVSRIEMLTEVLAPLTAAMISSSDQLVFSKTELCDSEQLMQAIRFADTISDTILANAGSYGSELYSRFTAHSHRLSLCGEKNAAAKFQEAAALFMTDYLQKIDSKAVLLGHIKGVLEYDGGYMKLSCVEYSQGLMRTVYGEDMPIENAVLTLNSVLAGMSAAELDSLCEKAVSAYQAKQPHIQINIE